MKLTVFLRPSRYRGRGRGGKNLMRSRQLVIYICSLLNLRMLQFLSWGSLNLCSFVASMILQGCLRMIKPLISNGCWLCLALQRCFLRRVSNS
uniref:E8 n=1 Tax=Bovine papillomavirus type 1 TaxID=337052 RepID=K4PCP8_BPV1|nr:E8 [Deltapapillomavirus 4]